MKPIAKSRISALVSVVCIACLPGPQAETLAVTLSSSQQKGAVPMEQNLDSVAENTFVRNYGPKRTAPVFKGAFSVGMVLIQFPDTSMPAADGIKQRLFNFGPMTITDYFKEYSQGLSWPMPLIVGEEDLAKAIYMAPQPLGYYCAHDFWRNPLGFKGKAEGEGRAKALRDAAAAHAFKLYKKPPENAGIPLQSNGRPHLVCYAFATQLVSKEMFQKFIEPHYEGRTFTGTDKPGWPGYKPEIPWGDPLWPNSIPQVHVEGGGKTVCHELGHVLGAPDYYHAPERNDGVPGEPSLGWAYGPTGPGYCRYIYNGFLTAKNYPTCPKSGTYTVYPRQTNPAGDKPIGCFIPSSHPHYLFCIEYVKGEKPPLGNPGKQGLLISVINTTLTSSLLGAPEICYVYRPNDPWFRSGGDIGQALFGKATGRTSFSSASEPSSRLPNLLDSGVTIENIVEKDDSVTFDVTMNPVMLSRTAYNDSLVPKIKLDEITEILPSSFNAKSTVTFRGEPMKTDYGFCWNTMPSPRVPTGSLTANSNYFPLYHRDRYEARITGLRPNTKYYVRAYARNAKGLSYSENEITVTTTDLKTPPSMVPPLLQDNFTKNWSIEKYYGFAVTKTGDFIGSTAPATLLKLTAYYRKALGSAKSKKSGIDYTRIHVNPSESRPEFRMKEFTDALHECKRLAKEAGMLETDFSDDFDKAFIATFDLKQDRMLKVKPIEELSAASMANLEPAIKASLLNSQPVLAGLDSVQLSPRSYGLSWVIIDGFNEKGQYHIVFPRDEDRAFNVTSGWYSLDVLLNQVEKTKLIFGMGAN